ncbi:MAG TPA: hypothetical protein VLS89_14910 [Candidatus Nanopelagicales bacterium]|nr:hypothetical protein [Candidatus Nanopelagicales bacterium]
MLLPTLHAGGLGAKKAEELRNIKERDPDARVEFPGHWNQADVRGALYAMHGGVCAYCNAGLGPDRGDVDHFRPKKPSRNGEHQGYWWLAYELGNYFLSCRVCNEHRKLERFPLEEGALRTEYATRAAVGDELRLLVDPALDPVEDWMKVDCMSEKQPCSVSLRPSCTAAPVAPERVANTVDFFRLNKDIRLVRERILARNEVAELLGEHLGNPTNARREKLRRLASRYRPQGMTVRAFLEDFAPEIALPSPEEELRWLLEEIDELLLLDARCADTDDACTRDAEELRWALAVLWKDPPAGTPALIEQWLDETGWREVVEPKYRQLN